MKADTDNNNYSGSPNRPLFCICNLFHLRRLLIKFLESGPSSVHDLGVTLLNLRQISLSPQRKQYTPRSGWSRTRGRSTCVQQLAVPMKGKCSFIHVCHKGSLRATAGDDPFGFTTSCIVSLRAGKRRTAKSACATRGKRGPGSYLKASIRNAGRRWDRGWPPLLPDNSRRTIPRRRKLQTRSRPKEVAARQESTARECAQAWI